MTTRQTIIHSTVLYALAGFLWLLAALLVAGCASPRHLDPRQPPAPPASPAPILDRTVAAAQGAADQLDQAVVPQIAAGRDQVAQAQPEKAQQTLQKAQEAAASVSQTLRTGVIPPAQEARQLALAVEKRAGEWQATAKAEAERADREKARADSAFRSRLLTFAALAIAGAVLCGGLAVWALIRGSVTGAAGLGALAAALVACAVALYVFASFWPWIVGGVGLALAGAIAYLVVARVKLDRATAALSAVVRGIEQVGTTDYGAADAVKAAVAAAAGAELATVKQVVTAIKAREGLLDPSAPAPQERA